MAKIQYTLNKITGVCNSPVEIKKLIMDTIEVSRIKDETNDIISFEFEPKIKKYIYYTKIGEMYYVPLINKIFGTTMVKCRFPW